MKTIKLNSVILSEVLDGPKTTNFKLDALDFRIVLGLDSMKLKSTSDDRISH